MEMKSGGNGSSRLPPFQRAPKKQREIRIGYAGQCLLICIPICTIVCIIVDKLVLGG